MKKAMTVLGAIIFASIVFTSCGGGKTELDLKPKSTTLKGNLSEYFTVVDGTYKLLQENEKARYDGDFDFNMKVQIKRTDKQFMFDKEKIGQGQLFISCDLFDQEGVPVILADGGDQGVYATQGVNQENEVLLALKSGETGWVTFSYQAKKEAISKVKTLQVGSYLSDQLNSNENLNNENNNSSSANIDCDKFIKDYEAFINSYIKLLKKYKANPTDASILTEYTEAAQKATEMETNASECNDPKYASKLIELSNKLAKALQ